MKKLIAISLLAMFNLLLAGCSPSVSDLQQQVQISFSQNIQSDPQLAPLKLTVEHVELVHSDGNNYQGIIYLSYRGNQEQVPVHVVADGNKMTWEVPPGSFGFAAQDIFRAALQQGADNYNRYMQQASTCTQYLQSGDAARYQSCLSEAAKANLGSTH